MSRIKNLSTLVLSVGLGAGFTVVTAAQEPLATIERIDGSAMVSEGARYVEAREGKQLVENDRLLVLEGGSATIQFADGCKRTMDSSELLTVSSTSPCALESAGAPATAGVQGLPDAATAISSPSFAAVEQGATSQMTAGAGGSAAIAAAAVAAVVVGAVVVENNSDDDGDNTPLPTPSP